MPNRVGLRRLFAALAKNVGFGYNSNITHRIISRKERGSMDTEHRVQAAATHPARDWAVRRMTYQGLMMIRRLRRLRRRLAGLFALLGQFFSSLRGTVRRAFVALAVRNGLDHSKATETLHRLREEQRNAKSRGPLAALGFWGGQILKGFWYLIRLIFLSPSYLLPIVAFVVFIGVVHNTLDKTFALHVEYNGNDVGYILNESVYEMAERQMRGRIAFEDYIRPADAIPHYTIAAVDEDLLLDVNKLTDELIRASGNELGEATGLYIDDEFISAATDGDEIRDMLEAMLEPYRSSNSANETVSFVKDVELVEGLYPLSSIRGPDAIYRRITSQQQEERIYTTVAGDSPSSIAQKNGISISTLRALNPDIDNSLLVGQEVKVQQSVPYLEVQITRTEVYDEEIPFRIVQSVDSSEYEGYYNRTQVGEAGINRITAEVTYLNGVETERKIVSEVTVSDPVDEKVTVGGKSIAEVGAQSTSSGFIWPTAKGYVSCPFHGYYGHTGMDIATDYGTPVYASASGIVTKVQYSRIGYGYHVIISHGGNIETLYGHCSELYVSVGQWVSQGEVIAAVGRTGNASGNHLHFEVRSNGKYLDPASYIGSKCPY